VTLKASNKNAPRTDVDRASRESEGANKSLGPLVRRLRRRDGLTLQQLADTSGVSRAMLSSVERGDRNPTLPVLAGIASGLGVTMSELMGEQAPWTVASVTPRRSRLVFRDDHTGIERHLLSPTHLDTGMEVVEHILPGGQSFDGVLHAGIRTSKCVVVTEGQLSLELGNVLYTLDATDSVTFEVTGEYRFRNKLAQVCRYYIFMIHQRMQPHADPSASA